MSRRGQVRRCAIYTRKSTTRGLEQEYNTLDAQRDACEHYIKAQVGAGWQALSERFDDGGFSGASLERPAFQKLMEAVDAGEVDVVVVYKVDRLSRSLLDFAQAMQRFKAQGVDFVSVTQSFSTADAIGQLTLNILMSFAEFERQMIAERTRDKKLATKRQGRWVSGAPPFGYELEQGKLVQNPPEAAIVKEVFALYRRLGSSMAVVDKLRQAGRTTRRFRTKALGRGGAWTKGRVLKVLRDPVYAGYIAHEDERFEGQHEALVDRGVFEAVQKALDGNVKRSGHGGRRNPAFILRGLIRCAQCGAAMTPHTATGRGRKSYRYYRCVSEDKGGKAACPTSPVPAADVERVAVQHVRAWARDEALTRRVHAELREELERERTSLGHQKREHPQAIGNLRREVATLTKALGNTGDEAPAALVARLREREQELATRRARLREVDAQLAALADADVELEWVETSLRNFDDVWAVMTLDNRRRLLEGLIGQVRYDASTGRVETVRRRAPAESGEWPVAPAVEA